MDTGYKMIAPAIDDLTDLAYSNDMNTKLYSKEINDLLLRISETLRPLKPMPNNQESKELWLTFPRGELEDWSLYQEAIADGEEDLENFREWWLDAYPDEVCWYRLVFIENDAATCVSLGGKMFILAISEEEADRRCTKYGMTKSEMTGGAFCEGELITLLEMIQTAAEKSMEELKNGAYNNRLSELPFNLKTGLVLRSALWEACPEEKEALWKDMDDKTFNRFRCLIESGKNSMSQIGLIPKDRMTGGTFLRACSLGYRACGFPYEGLSYAEQYILHADGRDEGLTGITNDWYHRGDGRGIDMDSPEAWFEWYFNREMKFGHPWEVIRGGNMTHVDLIVLAVPQEAYSERIRLNGYYFAVSGISAVCVGQAVKFYVALREAGLPVILRDGDAILKRYLGEDYVGIVPSTRTPVYCGDLFSGVQEEIIDYTHIERDEYDILKDKIRWLPVKGAELA